MRHLQKLCLSTFSYYKAGSQEMILQIDESLLPEKLFFPSYFPILKQSPRRKRELWCYIFLIVLCHLYKCLSAMLYL